MRPRLRILVVASDPEQRDELRNELSKRFAIDSVDAVSPEESDHAFDAAVPAIVLLSALMPQSSEERVIRQLEEVDPEGFVPVLTVPPFVTADSPAASSRERSVFNKRPAAPIVRDPDMVMARIGETLARLRDESSCPRTHSPERVVRRSEIRRPPDPKDTNVTTAIMRIAKPVLTGPSLARTQLARASRMTPDDLPHAVSLTTANGIVVRLLNLSTTGLLFESPFKFIPGNETALHLIGPEGSTALPCRFVRSEVSAVEARGVTYRTAVRFNKEVDVLASIPARIARPAATMQAVADLLVRVASCHSGRGDYAGARAVFEAGLRKILPGCEVNLRETLVKPSAGRESVYFTIPSSWGAIMQATFTANHALSAEEFAVLKMASAAAAVILQFEGVAVDRRRRGQVA